MAILLSHTKFTIYTAGAGARELILLSHGALIGDGKAKPPSNACVYFYDDHWKTSSGTVLADGLAGTAHSSAPDVQSISGPGSPVWDYTLTWGGPGGKRPQEQKLIDRYAKGQGSATRDLFTPEVGHDVTLKELFKAIEKAGLQYHIIHYCPCRSVMLKDGTDVYEPRLKQKMDRGEIEFMK